MIEAESAGADLLVGRQNLEKLADLKVRWLNGDSPDGMPLEGLQAVGLSLLQGLVGSAGLRGGDKLELLDLGRLKLR
jgi:hypothetical protein